MIIDFFVFRSQDLHVKRDVNTLLQASAVLERRMVLRMSGRSRALHSFVNKNIIYTNMVAEKNPNIYLWKHAKNMLRLG